MIHILGSDDIPSAVDDSFPAVSLGVLFFGFGLKGFSAGKYLGMWLHPRVYYETDHVLVTVGAVSFSDGFFLDLVLEDCED
jgi:hypothetical protein